MTKDEIRELAQQAGFMWGYIKEEGLVDGMTAFANLVAQHEREIREQRCERLQSLMDIRETQPNKPCCLAEREACAKIVEESSLPDAYSQECMPDIANDIRARGQE